MRSPNARSTETEGSDLRHGSRPTLRLVHRETGGVLRENRSMIASASRRAQSWTTRTLRGLRFEDGPLPRSRRALPCQRSWAPLGRPRSCPPARRGGALTARNCRSPHPTRHATRLPDRPRRAPHRRHQRGRASRTRSAPHQEPGPASTPDPLHSELRKQEGVGACAGPERWNCRPQCGDGR